MMSYFGLREWKFSNDNIKSLSTKFKDYDKFSLDFNVETIDWKEYFAFYMLGIKKYYFKENFDRANQIKQRYRRFVLEFFICFVLFQ